MPIPSTNLFKGYSWSEMASFRTPPRNIPQGNLYQGYSSYTTPSYTSGGGSGGIGSGSPQKTAGGYPY